MKNEIKIIKEKLDTMMKDHLGWKVRASAVFWDVWLDFKQFRIVFSEFGIYLQDLSINLPPPPPPPWRISYGFGIYLVNISIKPTGGLLIPTTFEGVGAGGLLKNR